MIAKKSLLILKNFILIKNTLEFIQPLKQENINIIEIFNSYDIDIDYKVKQFINPYYHVFVKLNINSLENKKVGYSIFIEGVSVFEFDNTVAIDDSDKYKYLYLSGIPICINYLRSIITNITANGAFGKYILPSIDLNYLFKNKQTKLKKT